MKKIILSFLFLLCTFFLSAQCTVVLDAVANANGANAFAITTTKPNEIIMISYDGWNGPGSGPVTVDGFAATLVSIANNGNSGTAEVYAYPAAVAGVHNIICTETGYSYAPYGINYAASFYTNGCVLNLASITGTVINTIVCTTGGSISQNITTTVANEMVYCAAEINNGQAANFPISWTNATFLATLHIGNGIDASHAYTLEPVAGVYNITATNAAPLANGCGGLCLILVGIKPCVCALPIELEKFECVQNNEGVQLNWATASETKSSYFTLERSYDGHEFISIAKLNAAGNSQTRHNYSFMDVEARKGNNYYRLLETDVEGHSQTFDIQECSLKHSINVEMYPNPNNGSYTLLLGPSNLVQTLVVMNVNEQIIFTKQFEPSENGGNYNIELPEGCRGVFISKVLNGDQVLAIKKLITY